MAAFGGAVIVTFNTRTLGGRISFFQSVAILGYCIFPLFIAGVLLKVLQMIGFQHIVMKVAVMVAGAFWGVFCTYYLMQRHRCSSRLTSTSPNGE
jgi:hypothetical protein